MVRHVPGMVMELVTPFFPHNSDGLFFEKMLWRLEEHAEDCQFQRSPSASRDSTIAIGGVKEAVQLWLATWGMRCAHWFRHFPTSSRRYMKRNGGQVTHGAVRSMYRRRVTSAVASLCCRAAETGGLRIRNTCLVAARKALSEARAVATDPSLG
jgi:hypothetical protein